MGEPVGNSPRDAIPGNSHKDRERQARDPRPQSQPEEPREKLEKVVTGKVTVSRPPWWKRFGRGMFANDAQTLGEYFMQDLLVPTLKTVADELIVGLTRGALWGPETRGRGPRYEPRGGGIRSRYDKMADDDRGRPRMSREAQRNHEFNEIKLVSRAEAIDVIERLVVRIDKYGKASVADLYDYLGVTGSYADQNHGWYDLRDADVRQYRGDWLLDLPTPEPLRR